MQNYLRDPEKIERQTYDRIRELTTLDRFNQDEKQIVLHMVRRLWRTGTGRTNPYQPGRHPGRQKSHQSLQLHAV
ncbi:MAG: hypothetical protein R3E89_12620 [Thiolinea sp.]